MPRPYPPLYLFDVEPVTMKTDQSPAPDAPTTGGSQMDSEQVKDTKRDAAKKGKGKKPPPDPKEVALGLLKNSVGGIYLHPGQDFDGKRLWYGKPTGSDSLVMVNSDRELFPTDQMPSPYAVYETGLDRSSFSREGIQKYVYNSLQVDGLELINELASYFKNYIVFEDERLYTLFSLWSIGTYCYTIFRVYAYLSLRSASKECGKSRALDLLSLVCFNADPRTTAPTKATIFRGTARHSGTLILDEIENLTSVNDTDSSVLDVLNSGFEQGGYVSRMEQRGNNFIQIKYSTYSPKALAGINKLADTISGRCITVYLMRKRRDVSVKRLSPARLRAELQPLRDKISVWCLSNAASVARIYFEEIAHNNSLNCLGDRDRDLWEPLISIATVIEGDATECNDLINSMVSLAVDSSQDKYQAEDEQALRLIGRLEQILGEEDTLEITPTDLLEAIKGNKGFSLSPIQNTKVLAGRLATIGMKSVSKWDTTEHKAKRVYTISREGINDLKARYLRPDSPAIPPEKA